MVGFADRFGSLRPLLAACLTVLLLVTSFAPCCAFAKPVDGAHVSAPFDPCERPPAAPWTCVCTQLACQAFDHTAFATLIALSHSTPADFVFAIARFSDRDERPDHPPPRTLL